MPNWSRRTFLAATSATSASLLAGCNSVTSSSPPPRVELTAEQRSPDWFASLWDPETPRADPVREAIDATVAGDRYVTVGYPSLPEGRYVERDGTYYRTDSVHVGRETHERYVLRLEHVGDSDDSDTPAATSIDALPDPDRSAVRRAYFAARAAPDEPGGEWSGAPWETIEHGGAVYRRTDPADSELISDLEHEYVEAELGMVLRVDVSRERITDPVMRAVLTPVAESEAGFIEGALAAELTTTFYPGQLSSEAVTVLDELTGRTEYAESAPVSAGYARVLQRLDLGDATTLPTDGDEDLPPRRRRAFEYDGSYFEAGFAVTPGDER